LKAAKEGETCEGIDFEYQAINIIESSMMPGTAFSWNMEKKKLTTVEIGTDCKWVPKANNRLFMCGWKTNLINT